MGLAITRNSLLLAGFALLTAVLVASTFLGTRERISEAQRFAEERALLEIVPRDSHDNNMLDDRLMAPAGDPYLQLPEERPIYLARREGRAIAAIVPVVAPDGYSGNIDFIVGVHIDGTVAGVRVLRHRETPGLGDAVDQRKSDWIEGFRGRSLGNPALDGWNVRKDGGVFDQFTGATITPRAVVKATARALEYVQSNRRALFGTGSEPVEKALSTTTLSAHGGYVDTGLLEGEAPGARQKHWEADEGGHS